MDTKTCTSCGVDKPITDFRKYYAGRKGHYRYCKACERIETRRKYLVGKDELQPAEQQELADINKLYEMHIAKGLRPPVGTPKSDTTHDLVRQMLEQEKEDRVN